MPSVHRKPRSPYWHAAYTLPDGRRTLRSTKCRDKRKALQVAFEYQKAADVGRDGRLAEEQARRVIGDIFAIANHEAMPAATVREHVEAWLEMKEHSVTSVAEHRRAARDFLQHIGTHADKPVDALGVKHVASWYQKLRGELTVATANKLMRLMQGAFTQAVRLGYRTDNPFSKVDLAKKKSSERRALTLDELKSVLAVASNEWRGVVLFGVYTGQRLTDIAKTTWAQLDLHGKQGPQVTFTPRKTGKRRTIPLAAPLLAWLMEQDATDNPSAPLFPSLYHLATPSLSHQFTDILAAAGLATPTAHTKGKARAKGDKRRQTGNLSFHYLRHTATSLLKNAGASDVVAREIIGHDSEAVSRLYSHIETGTLKRAVDALPDITKG